MLQYDSLVFDQMYASLDGSIRDFVAKKRNHLQTMGPNLSRKTVATVEKRLMHFIKAKSIAGALFTNRNHKSSIISINQESRPHAQPFLFDQNKLAALQPEKVQPKHMLKGELVNHAMKIGMRQPSIRLKQGPKQILYRPLSVERRRNRNLY